MERKDRIDAFGATLLTGFSVLLAFNQVVIRVVDEGLQPVFFAGLRSAGAALCLWAWLWFRGRPAGLYRSELGAGLLMGSFFAAEFICLFIALDLTTVARVSVIFYTMPLWFALGAHLWLPGERITGLKALGLGLSFAGVALALLWRNGGGGEASLTGDLLALVAAFGWAGVAMVARTGLSGVPPESQLLWQLTVSAPILLGLSPFFGPLIRDLRPVHLLGLGFQVVAVAWAGFLLWFWLLKHYPAASVAAFAFLTPVFGVLFGWALLGEAIGLPILAALLLVSVGLVLISRPVQVPQKV